MYSAYFDESGTDGVSKSVVVSGVIAGNDQWRDFENAWKRALDNARVTRFHMRDFAHSLREFKNWKGDEDRRSKFLKELIEIIRRNTRHTFSTAVIITDYQSINQKYQLSEYASPYVIGAFQGVVDVAKWCNAHEYIEPVNVVFEDGVKHKGEFLAFYVPANFHKISYAKSTQFIGFQAADLVAWETRKAIDQLHAGKLKRYRRYRQSYSALFAMPNKWGVYEKSFLERWCRNLKIPLRNESIETVQARA